MMCKKLFYLVFVFVLSFACTSYADTVIGDFENGSFDSFALTWVEGITIAPSDIGVTSGTGSLAISCPVDLANHFVWGVLANVNPAQYDAVQLDLTWVASDWVGGGWAQFVNLAVNSDAGWYQVDTVADSVRGEDYPGNWDSSIGDYTTTLTWDISGYDPGNSEWMQIIFSQNNGGFTAGGKYYIDNVRLFGGEKAEPTVPFSLGVVGDITVCNDDRCGPDQNRNGTGLEARDTADPRREVILLSYDISGLKKPVSNVSFSHLSYDQNDEVNVYGVIEDLDLLDVESLTWNTAPGVKNDPTPELNSPVVLDMNDLTDVLLTFVGPGESGVRFSTDTSDALADFINADTDGILTFLISAAAEGDSLIIRSRELADGGSFLEGDATPKANIIWVSDNKGYGTEPNLAADHGFVDLLRANGYLVDYKNEFEYIDGTQYWRTLDDNKVAELEAADLVIMSRNGDSGSYSTAADNEPNKWNAVTTPILNLSAYMARSNKWGWLNGTSTFRAKESMMQVIEPDHPVFAGVTIDPNGLVEVTSDQYYMDWVAGVTDAGNGIILATRPEDNLLSIVTWETGQKYFDEGLYTAGGPRMLFIVGTGSGNNAPEYSPDGAYNLTADGETMFLNAVAYMLAPEPAGPSEEGLVAYYALDGDATDSSGNGLDGAEEIMGEGNAATYVAGVSGLAVDLLPAELGTIGPYVNCGADPMFDINDTITVSAWVNFRSIPDEWRGIVTKGDNTWRLSNMGATTAFQFSFAGYGVRPNNIYSADGTIEVGFDSWHHVCGTYDTTNGATLYVDGVVDKVTPDSVGIDQNTNDVWIGGNNGDTGWKPYRLFDGMIDEVKIYHRALSADEVAALAGM